MNQNRQTIAAKKRSQPIGRIALTALAVAVAVSLLCLLIPDREQPNPSGLANDVTQMNPIMVERVITPTTTEEIVEAVRIYPGAISIGGGRYSMGGQTASEGALKIDMRRYSRMLNYSPTDKSITAQAGNPQAVPLVEGALSGLA